ncbi:AAA family ATPase [uncultured Halopseudomonas sp.]|uniref:ATP-binding protein n=1 Tax=uncultured Halopseudomonas sp. TaxID=2901193 RepID=UPI0030EE0EA0|tara:strand:- start:14505 stop:15593 length:1089 start_codon:yes stop_codon:yes gene_type:complete
MSKYANKQRLPAEAEYHDELERLTELDEHPVPPGWRMSPVAVGKFVEGDKQLGIERKFVCEPEVITRVVIALCTNRGALLVGEPGTAKSLLSELIAAAASGDSSLMIQGGAVNSLNQLLYTWNEALLREQGPCLAALVPSPLLRAMRDGKLLRFEEIARCPQTLQDSVLSILSDRVISIPELPGEDGVIYASEGFNIIATSNSVDEGVNRMSAALKRRMNFEIVKPIARLSDEIDVVLRQTEKLNAKAGITFKPDPSVLEVLVTVFHELRNGQTVAGRSTDRLAGAAMSTAEAVAVAHAMSVHAFYYTEGQMSDRNLVHFLLGSALKDKPEDRRRLRHYFDTEVAQRKGAHWRALYAQRHLL